MKKILFAIVTLLGLMSAASAAPILNTANGHYYDYVGSTSGFSFAEALANASTLSHNGWTGYMATVTDMSEHNFIVAMTGATAWIAASDAASEGVFQWMAGPEAGMALTFSNWAGGEPNDYSIGEDETVINWGAGGSWNDIGNPAFPNYRVGYIIEFSAPNNQVPEPGTIALMLLALTGLGIALRRQS